MSEYRLVCNVQQCHQILYESAVVTTCSHIFCTNHELLETCPVCHKQLIVALDFAPVNLEPNKAIKSRMLAGLRPELIVEIAARALKFWGYQTDSSILYTEGALMCLVQNILLQTNNSEIHTEYNKVVNSFKQQIRTLNEELNLRKVRYEDLLKQYQKNTKKYNKLKMKVKNHLKRKLPNQKPYSK